MMLTRSMQIHLIVVQRRWISPNRLTDHSGYVRELNRFDLLDDKSKPLVEPDESTARRCGGVIALGCQFKTDLRRIAIREFAKLSHDGRADALFSVIHDNPG
jgi:hypothetical protein